MLAASISLASIATVGCGGASLQQRAAFDVGCPAGDLVVTDLGGNSRGVEGCGCRATYVNGSPGRTYGDTWILNATSGTCQAQIQHSSGN